MTNISVPTRTDSNENPVIADELTLVRQWLPIADATLLDLGCGPAPISRRLLECGARQVVYMDTDARALATLLASSPPAGMQLVDAGAERIPFPDAGFDGVIMMKSLHHVPVASMDMALREIARVLKANGVLYVSEPVYAGEFNDVVRLFHDEGHVRREAVAAMERAVINGVYVQETELHYISPIRFKDFSEFQNRIINVTHNTFDISNEKMEEIRAAFDGHMTENGAFFARPMRLNVLRKAVT